MDLFAEPGPDDRIEEAARRLEHAAVKLEQRIARHIDRAAATKGSVMDADRAGLAAQLDAARGRERALREAGEEASAALAEAIARLRQHVGAGEV